jgi:hypothetical protein
LMFHPTATRLDSAQPRGLGWCSSPQQPWLVTVHEHSNQLIN